MKLLSNSELFNSLKYINIQAKIDLDVTFSYSSENNDSRFWEIPIATEHELSFLAACLESLAPWKNCWVYKGGHSWDATISVQKNSSINGLGIINQWIGIPDNYKGSLKFDFSERCQLMLLLTIISNRYSNLTNDLFLFPDNGQQYLWLDHEGVLWVCFFDKNKIDDYINSMSSFGFELPSEPYDSIPRQHWMQ